MYREELPASCPPSDAFEIEGELTVYRLVDTIPPEEKDFDSHIILYPTRKFKDQCNARGVSVYTDVEDADKKRKLPTLKKKHVCRVSLVAGCGKIKQTFDPSHHTWWPFKDFNILHNCNGAIE